MHVPSGPGSLPCRTRPRFDATAAEFTLFNQWISIRDSLVGSLTILGSIGVRKSMRNLLMLLMSPSYCRVLLVILTAGLSIGINCLIC